jgi:hypothetical protein
MKKAAALIGRRGFILSIANCTKYMQSVRPRASVRDHALDALISSWPLLLNSGSPLALCAQSLVYNIGLFGTQEL